MSVSKSRSKSMKKTRGRSFFYQSVESSTFIDTKIIEIPFLICGSLKVPKENGQECPGFFEAFSMQF